MPIVAITHAATLQGVALDGLRSPLLQVCAATFSLYLISSYSSWLCCPVKFRQHDNNDSPKERRGYHAADEANED